MFLNLLILYPIFENKTYLCAYKNEEEMPLSRAYSNLNDDQLFDLIAQDDKGAFTEVYLKYNKLLYAVAYKYLLNKELAEDTVQYVYTRLWEYRNELNIGISLKNYLFTMAKNYVLNTIRDEGAAMEKNYVMAQSAPEYEDNLVENLEKKDMMSFFYKAINSLSAQKRDICLMKIRDDMSTKEIAERMNLSVNTVKTHYSEALKILRMKLGEVLIFVIAFILTSRLGV